MAPGAWAIGSSSAATSGDGAGANAESRLLSVWRTAPAVSAVGMTSRAATFSPVVVSSPATPISCSGAKSSLANAAPIYLFAGDAAAAAVRFDSLAPSDSTRISGSDCAGTRNFSPHLGHTPRWLARKLLTCNLCPLGQRNLIPIAVPQGTADTSNGKIRCRPPRRSQALLTRCFFSASRCVYQAGVPPPIIRCCPLASNPLARGKLRPGPDKKPPGRRKNRASSHGTVQPTATDRIVAAPESLMLGPRGGGRLERPCEDI